MARVRFSVPSLLAAFTGGERSFEVEARTLDGALQAAVERYPMLSRHLWDEDGRQRRHVNLFYNDQALRWMADLAFPVEDGDEVVILQAVSGGSASAG